MSEQQPHNSSSSATVFVGGISWKADEASLNRFFTTFGPVVESKIIVDRATGKSKGYGFVTFQDAETAEKAKASKDLFFLGKTMNVGDAYRKYEKRSDYNGSNDRSSKAGSQQPYYMTPQQMQQYYGYNPAGYYYGYGYPYPQQPEQLAGSSFVPYAYPQLYSYPYDPAHPPEGIPMQYAAAPYAPPASAESVTTQMAQMDLNANPSNPSPSPNAEAAVATAGATRTTAEASGTEAVDEADSVNSSEEAAA